MKDTHTHISNTDMITCNEVELAWFILVKDTHTHISNTDMITCNEG